MIATVLLVYWANGWAEVGDIGLIGTYGRREATLGLGAIQSIEEVNRICREQFRLYGEPLIEISVDLHPQMSVEDRPYRAFGVGDVVSTVPGPGGPTEERCLELTVQEDENGVVTYAPTFRDVIIEAQEAFQETLKKMANGTLGGSPAATPLSAVTLASSPDCCPPAVATWTLTFPNFNNNYGTDTFHYTFDGTFGVPTGYRLTGSFTAGTNNSVSVYFVIGGTTIFDTWTGLGTTVDVTGGIHETLTGDVGAGDEVWMTVAEDVFDSDWDLTLVLTFEGNHANVVQSTGLT